MKGYKFVSEVNNIGLIEFMYQDENNIATTRTGDETLRWENKRPIWDNGEEYINHFNNNFDYKCYSKINEPLDEVWMPKTQDGSYRITNNGKIKKQDWYACFELFEKLNQFKTKDQAHKIRDKFLWILAQEKIKEAIDGDFEPDWYDDSRKWFIFFKGKGYTTDWEDDCPSKETVYYSSYEKCEQSLEWLQRLSKQYSLRWFE